MIPSSDAVIRVTMITMSMLAVLADEVTITLAGDLTGSLFSALHLAIGLLLVFAPLKVVTLGVRERTITLKSAIIKH